MISTRNINRVAICLIFQPVVIESLCLLNVNLQNIKVLSFCLHIVFELFKTNLPLGDFIYYINHAFLAYSCYFIENINTFEELSDIFKPKRGIG